MTVSLHAVLVDPLRAAPPAGWNAFVTDQRLLPFWRAELLTTSAWCAQTPMLMGLAADRQGTPVALFHARHVGLPANPRRYLQPGGLSPVGAVECRLSPIAGFSGLAFAAGLDQRDRAEAIRAFEHAAHRRLGWRCLAVAYRNLTAADLRLVQRRARVTVETDPPVAIENKWPDIRAYLASLPAKWSSQVRRIHEATEADPNLRVTVERSIPAAEAIPLLQAVRARYQHPRLIRPPIPVRYLEQLGSLPGTHFLTYRNRLGRLLAFAAVHESRDGLCSTFWGNRDRPDGGLPNLYFDQYLRAVRLMIEGGHSRLDLGKGQRSIKERYGAQPTACFSVAGR
jgi:Acetyltransferase (GNAT) domain